MSTNPQTPEACLEKWIQDSEDDGLLIKTLQTYRNNAKYLIRMMRDNERDPLPYHWTKDDLKWIKSVWDDSNLKTRTQLHYHNAFCQFAEHFGNMQPKLYKIKWPSLEGSGRLWLELPEARVVANWPKSPMQDWGIECMLRCGRRRIEVLRANMSDICAEAKDPYMLVDGKGHKRHIMPFAPTTYKSFYKWVDEREKRLMEVYDRYKKVEKIEKVLLYAVKGKVNYYNPEKGTGFDKAVTEAVRAECGIHFTNHALRRTFGRELYFTAGVKDVIIQGYYNHDSLDQTLWYIGADQRRMSEAMQKIPF